MQEWRAAGLNVPCGVKGQIATVEEKLVIKTVGSLGAIDRQVLDARLAATLMLKEGLARLFGSTGGRLQKMQSNRQVT